MTHQQSPTQERPWERTQEIVNRHGLEPLTENTITEMGELVDDLEQTRERGYAVDMEEAKRGMLCIAALVAPDESGLYGAVSVAAPESRMHGNRFEEKLPDLVTGTANVIELSSIYVSDIAGENYEAGSAAWFGVRSARVNTFCSVSVSNRWMSSSSN